MKAAFSSGSTMPELKIVLALKVGLFSMDNRVGEFEAF